MMFRMNGPGIKLQKAMGRADLIQNDDHVKAMTEIFKQDGNKSYLDIIEGGKPERDEAKDEKKSGTCCRC